MYWFKPLTFACHRLPAALVSILPVIAFIILTRPIHACSHYSFRSAANKAGRAGNWILEFSTYPDVCLLSTRVRMWRMLIRHRRTRVSESKQTTDMWKCKNSIPRTPGLFISSVSIFLSAFKYFCIRVLPENACSAFVNMICYKQSRNILFNRIGHGVFYYYSLRFSHFYGDAILNYLLEFFFAWTPNYQHKGIPEW